MSSLRPLISGHTRFRRALRWCDAGLDISLRFRPLTWVFSGDTIWGRVTVDNKNGLVGVLYISSLSLCIDAKNRLINRAPIESLLETGFQSTRTIILASGLDEEIGGDQVSNTNPLSWAYCVDLALLSLGRPISQ